MCYLGLDFTNEVLDRLTVFRNVTKLPAITADQAQLRAAGRKKMGSSIRLARTSLSRDKSSLLASKAVRSKLWMNGDLQAHSNVTINLRRDENKIIKGTAVYRYAILNGSNEKVIEEGNIDFLYPRGLLHPKGVRKGYWDFMIGLLIIYSVVAVPVTVAFTPNVSLARTVFELMIDSLFLCDVGINFRTVYFDELEDAYVAIPRLISGRYLRLWFFIDFLSSVPFDNIISWALQTVVHELASIRLIKIIRLTRLLKLVRIMKLSRYIHAIEETFGVSLLVFEMINMISQVLLIGHLLACAWWAISVSITSHGWFDSPDQLQGNLKLAEPSTQYITSLYQIVTTLTTTGYGDLYPTNSAERITMMFIMCIGASTFGYIVGSVASLIGTFNQSAAIKTERLTAISAFLSEKGCPSDLSGSIMRHFRHTYSEIAGVNEAVILERLPKSIALEITLLEHEEKFAKIPFFQFIENKSIRVFLFNLLRPIFYDTDQYIVREGDLSKEVIFFVSGTARVFHQPELRKWRMEQHKKRNNYRLQRHSQSFLRRYAHQTNETKLKQAENLVLTDQSALVDNSLHQIVTHNAALQAVISMQEMHSLSHRTDDDLEKGQSNLHRPFVMNNLQLNGLGGFGSAMRVHGINTNSYNPTQEIAEALGRIESSSSEDDSDEYDDDAVVVDTNTLSSLGAGEDVESTAVNNTALVVDAPSNTNEGSTENNQTDFKLFQKVAFSPEIRESFLDLSEGQASTREFSTKSSGKSGRPLARFRKLLFAGAKRKSRKHGTKGLPFHLRSQSDLKMKGREFVGDLSTGDFIGHGALMKNCELKPSVRALTPCSAYILHKTSIIELLERHPGVAMILQGALGRTISVALDTKGKGFVRSKRAEFLKEIKEISISAIRKSTSSPVRLRPSGTVSTQLSEPLIPSSVSSLSNDVVNDDQSLPVMSKLSAKDKWKLAKTKSLEYAKTSAKVIPTEPTIAEDSNDNIDYGFVGHAPTAPTPGIRRQQTDQPSTFIMRTISNSLANRLHLAVDVAKVQQQQTKSLAAQKKEREAFIQRILPDARLLYDSDEEKTGDIFGAVRRPLIRPKSTDLLQNLPSKTMTGDEFSEPRITKKKRSIYSSMQRRQSFPSLDNSVWKNTQHFETNL